MLNKKFKKAISAVTMFATVVCLSGVSMLAPLSVKAATTIADGDIIKSNATNSDGTPTIGSLDVYIVKIVGTKKFKRLVLNPLVFSSYGHLKWSNLKTVSQAEEDAYTTSDLVRVDGSDKVYALTPAGDTGAKSWVNVTADQFINGAGSDADSIYTINSVDAGNYTAKGDITTVAALKAFYKDGTLPGGLVSGDLTVSLAATTPESTNVPTASLVAYTDVKLAAGSSAVSINSITVSANGLGADSAFTNIALYVDGSKVGTSKTSINSSRQATFNFSTPIAIDANASKTLTIKASVSAASTYVLGIKAATDIITAGGSVGGTFPIWGNALSSVVNTSIGTVTLGTANGTDAPGTQFGTDNVLLAGFPLTANNEAALLSSIRLKNGGTNSADIISNLKLVIDGEAVADGTYDSATGYVDFNIDGNYKIKKSGTVSVEVYGDMGTATVGNTISLYIKNVDDIIFTGETYGYGVQIVSIANLDAVADAIVVTLATGDVTIDMNKAATPDKDVKAGSTGVVLGTFSITSNGEDATVNQIVNSAASFEIQGTGLTKYVAGVSPNAFTNLVMADTTTGATYDITPTWVSNTEWTLSMTDEISLVKGVKKTFEIKADLDSAIALTSTLKVVIGQPAITITGDKTDSNITNVTPSSVTSATATVKAASLTWTTSALSSKTVVPGAKDVSIYQATLEAGTVDNVKLSTVSLSTSANAIDDFNDNNISKIDLYLGGKLIKSISNSIVEGTAGTKGSITFNSLITTDGANVIAKGATATLEAKATFASTLTSVASFSLSILSGTDSIISRDASDNSTIVESVANVGTGSRTIAAATQGTLKVELLTSSTKADENVYVLAGTSTPADKYLGELKFTTANEAVKLTDLKLINSGNATSADIAEVDLVDASGVVKANKIPAANGDVTFSGLSLVLPADQSTSYFIAVKVKGMNIDGDATATATYGNTIKYHIDATALSMKATGVDSTLPVTLAVSTTAGVQSVTTLTVGAIPVAAETITIGDTATGKCVVTFSVAADELNCADGAANIKQNDGAESTTTIGDSLRLLTNLSGYTISGATTAVIFTHVGTPVAGNMGFTDGTTGDVTSANTTVGTADSVAAGKWSQASVLSKTETITGSVLNTITNALTDGALTGGSNKVIGKYTFVFDNGSNRTATNDELKAIMDKLSLNVSKATGVTLANINASLDGSSTLVAASTPTLGGGTSGTITWNAGVLQGLADSGKVDGSITLVITADVTTTATAGEYFQTSIGDLNGVNTDSFNYIGNGLTNGTPIFTNMYLPVSQVSGGTLSKA